MEHGTRGDEGRGRDGSKQQAHFVPQISVRGLSVLLSIWESCRAAASLLTLAARRPRSDLAGLGWIDEPRDLMELGVRGTECGVPGFWGVLVWSTFAGELVAAAAGELVGATLRAAGEAPCTGEEAPDDDIAFFWTRASRPLPLPVSPQLLSLPLLSYPLLSSPLLSNSLLPCPVCSPLSPVFASLSPAIFPLSFLGSPSFFFPDIIFGFASVKNGPMFHFWFLALVWSVWSGKHIVKFCVYG